MKKYSIAAIIPAYNCQQTLERAVESLLTQTYPISEIIIVNNNSTDNTQQIINKLINEYPILVKSIIESKPGANLARNTGLKIAHGDWIQLLDADDELLPGKLNHQINLITAQPGADLICSAAIKIIDNDPAKINSRLYT
ncbi:MAG: glycosyltransferase family 2 protein [Saprospiraceae bacterium]|nr:glycosyltransferase family 2 protein [Candidatus Brachybacter algidus]